MKRILLTVLVLFTALSVNAQYVQITPTYGYHFGGKLNGFNADLLFKSADSYGVNLDVELGDEDLMVTFFWTRQDSYVNLKEFGVGEYRLAELVTEYFQLGITRQHTEGSATVFGTGTLGIVNFTPKDSQYGAELRMGGSLGGGLKYLFTDKIGIRLHARMLIPFQWGSAGVFCGTGGCGTSVGASSTVIQGDVGGGLIFNLQ